MSALILRAPARPLALLLALLHLVPALAQTASPNSPPVPTASGHGFAETLAAPRAPVRRAAAGKTPFEPVRPSAADQQTTELEMFVGESRVFAAPGVARIAVGNGSLLSAAALDGKEVILFANGVGTSSLFIWNEDGRYQRVKIQIVPGDTGRHARDIASFLSTIPRARASVIGTHVVVEGDELSDADLKKIDLLAERYPQIINVTNRVGWEQMVMMDVKVVEFPVSVLKETGLKWNATGGAAVGAIWSPYRRGNDGPYEVQIESSKAPPIAGIDGPTRLPNGLNILSALNMGLNAQLNLLAQDGKAVLLAEPQLSARSGTKASFIAGGQIPYSTVSQNGTQVQLQSYGIKLDIKPQVDRNGVIRASISAEVSSIDRSVSTPVGPGLLTRRTETEFNVRDGETIVLGGLLQRDNSTDIDKVPLLGDIPVLGALFRSKRYQNKETELVVFVTPRIAGADSPWMQQRIERTEQRLQERLGSMPHLSNPLEPGRNYRQLEAQPAPAAAAQRAEPAPDPQPAGTLAYGLPRDSGGALLRVKHGPALLREQPQAGARVLMRLEPDSLLRLGGRSATESSGQRHLQVRVGEVEGWVADQQLEPLPLAAQPLQRAVPQTQAAQEVGPKALRPAAADVAQPGQPAYRVQAAAGLGLHAAPDAGSSVLLRLSAGSLLWALPHAPQGPWLPVQYGSGSQARSGWVLAAQLLPLEARPQAADPNRAAP